MSAINLLMSNVKWVEVENTCEKSDLPHVTHEGNVEIGFYDIRCYTLSDGTRILDAEDVDAMFSGG